MPSRVVRGEINASDSLSRVSVGADLCFRALIVAVDDYGRLDARLLLLKSVLFPLRGEVEPAHIGAWLDELEAQGCVARYEVEGREFLHLPNWEKHRSNGRRAGASRFPAPPGVENPESPSGVYFVRSGDEGPVKIGYSTSLVTRIDSLKTVVPNLQVLAVLLEEGRAAEKRLHRQFQHLRVDREWFRGDPELLDWITENGQTWADLGRDGQTRAEMDNDGHCPSYRVASDEGRVAGSEGRVAGDDKEPAPKARMSCPEALEPEARERILAWAAKQSPPITKAQLGYAWQRVRDWADKKNARRTPRGWEATLRDAVRDGWALKGFKGSTAPTQSTKPPCVCGCAFDDHQIVGPSPSYDCRTCSCEHYQARHALEATA